MSVYVLRRKTKSPLKYHTSDLCPLVRKHYDSYEEVPERVALQRGYTHCQRYGACRAGRQVLRRG